MADFWKSRINELLTAYESGSEPDRRVMIQDFRRMADQADRWVESQQPTNTVIDCGYCGFPVIDGMCTGPKL